MAPTKSPRYCNFSGLFTVENIIPAVDKVQKGRHVRLLSGTIIERLQDVLNSVDGIFGLEYYGGYACRKFERFTHYDRTVLFYNNMVHKGSVIRQTASDTYNSRNPSFAFTVSDKKFDLFLFKSLFNYHLKKFRSINNIDNPFLSPDDLPGSVYITLE